VVVFTECIFRDAVRISCMKCMTHGIFVHDGDDTLAVFCVQYVTHEMYDDALKDLQDDNEIVRTGNNIRRTT